MIQRLNPHQFLTDIDTKTVYEASWRDLAGRGVINATIDLGRRTVSGSTKPGFLSSSYGETYTVQLEPHAEGTVVSVSCVANMPGTIDFGGVKRKAVKVSESIEALLGAGFLSAPGAVEPAASQPAASSAPIASPHGEEEGVRLASRGTGSPVYGTAPPILRGASVLSYGIAGLLCCTCLAPVTVIWGINVLKEYGPNDPGDKTQVMIGIALGVLASLGLVALVLINMMSA